jgi:hypothetical protein
MATTARWTRTVAATAAAVAVLAGCAPGLGKIQPTQAWRWAYSEGGIAGRRLTPQSENLGVVYSFVSDSLLFVSKVPGGTDTTHYSITKGGGTDGRDLIRYRHPVNVMAPYDSVQYLKRVGRDTLILSDRCADCYSHTFVRIRYN